MYNLQGDCACNTFQKHTQTGRKLIKDKYYKECKVK